jgi:hypothetical protein
MKQELVRTKSKISSLKREMSSIQQLHMAQQQVQSQYSAPAIRSSQQELEQYHSYHQQEPRSMSQSRQQPSIFTYTSESLDLLPSSNRIKNSSTSSNDESLSPPALASQPTCSVQSTQTTCRSSPSTIACFSNLISPLPLSHITNNNPPFDEQSTANHSTVDHDPLLSQSNEQLRLYLNETLQHEKDKAI